MVKMFIPGPVDVHPDVLAALTQPMLPHRSEAFERIFQRAAKKACRLFYTDQRVYLLAASGSGLQEAAVRNLANETVLSCVNGAFGARWYDMALANGKQADPLKVEWGKPITPDLVAQALGKKNYEVLTLVHNETSTGLQNPIREIAQAVKDISPETLICVDAVSSLGGARVEMDAWELDLVLTSSQKCLALPPGLALGAVADRALARAEQVQNRGWYFDFLRLEKHLNKNSTPSTPPLPLIYALDLQLDRILAEGLEERFARHSEMAARVQSWAQAKGFGLFASQGFRSQTVTAVRNDLGLDFSDLSQYLLSRGLRIANGYGPLKGQTFRIAHMGETSPADIELLLENLDSYLRR